MCSPVNTNGLILTLTGPRPSECDFFVGLSAKTGIAGTRRKCNCYNNIVSVIGCAALGDIGNTRWTPASHRPGFRHGRFRATAWRLTRGGQPRRASHDRAAAAADQTLTSRLKGLRSVPRLTRTVVPQYILRGALNLPTSPKSALSGDDHDNDPPGKITTGCTNRVYARRLISLIDNSLFWRRTVCRCGLRLGRRRRRGPGTEEYHCGENQ